MKLQLLLPLALAAITAQAQTDTFPTAIPTRNILVVTQAGRSQRIPCHVRTITQDQVTCGRAFHPSITYQRQDVATLIIPSHLVTHPIVVTVLLTIAAGAITGAVLVSLGPAIPLGILAAWCILATPWMSADDEPIHEHTIYQAPTPIPAT